VAAYLRGDGEAFLLDVLVQPRASRARIGPVRQDRLVVAVTAPPVEGAANRAVVELVAGALDVARSQVEVVRGDGSRRKTLRVRGATRAAIEGLGR
jgi:uncharacterized protein (TIGR00251 family)